MIESNLGDRNCLSRWKNGGKARYHEGGAGQRSKSEELKVWVSRIGVGNRI